MNISVFNMYAMKNYPILGKGNEIMLKWAFPWPAIMIEVMECTVPYWISNGSNRPVSEHYVYSTCLYPDLPKYHRDNEYNYITTYYKC